MFNLLGALVYLLVMALALAAVPVAARYPGALRRRVRRHWLALAALFAGLAAWRFGQGEWRLQELIRSLARAEGAYEVRRLWQAALLVVLIPACVVLVRRMIGGQRLPGSVIVSRAAALMLLCYSALRVISWHYIDVIIYASLGPIHMNFLIDMGLTGLAACGALIELGLLPRRLFDR